MKSNLPGRGLFRPLLPSIDQPWKRRAEQAGLAVMCFLSATQLLGANAPVGEWLDGSAAGTNLMDVSGYALAANHGAFVVGAGKFVFTNDVPPGYTGQSLFLYNGDTGLAISNSSTVDANYDNTFDNQINNSFTVSFWAKGWPGSWMPFVSKYGETTPSPAGGWQVRADASGHPCWTLRGTGGTTNDVALGTADGGNPDDLAASSLTYGNDGVWHFYAGTFDASTGLRKLYVDGGFVAIETNLTAYTLASLEHLCIGCKDVDGISIGNFFTGEIYDVRIYNYALPVGQGCAIPLAIASHNIAVRYGQAVQLNSSAPANPAPNLGYGWTSNGVPVSNANTNSLTISNVTANAVYTFIVTNACDETYTPHIFNVRVIFTNLVGRWFSGAQTLADVSGYQPPGTHDGQDIGNAGGSYAFTNDVPPGRAGYSLYLNNDGILITNSSILDTSYTNTFDDTINPAMTVAFWAKGWPYGWNPWVSKYGDSGYGWQFRADGQNSHSPVWTIQGTGTPCAVPVGFLPYSNPVDLAGTNVIGNDGKWHAYVGTYSSATGLRSLYVDGVLSATENCNYLYTLAPSEHVCIGAQDMPPGNAFARFFSGEIYDVRISSYDWSTNEVAAYSAIPDPVIITQPPQSVTGYASGNIQISAGVAGTAPLTNHWQFNSTNLLDGFYGNTLVTGSSSNILTLDSLTTNFQGTYRLVVSNTNGVAVSSNVAVTVVVAPPLNTNTLVGAWIMGSANLADTSGYSPAGTHDGYGAQGANVLTSHYAFTNDVPPGMPGQSLVLFGDAAIVIGNSSTLDASYVNTFDDTVTNAMTLMFWAKGWPSGQWNPWVSKYGENGQGWQLRRNAGTQFSAWTVRGSGGTEDMTATIPSNNGQWHQYVGTYDFTNGVRKLFVDGLLAATQSGQGPYTMAAGSHLVIGGKDEGSNHFDSYFSGEIYGVRLYKSAATFVSWPGPVPIPGPPMPIAGSNKLVLTWTVGTLQQATNPLGPWTPTGATSPYTNDVSAAPQMFFRLSYP